MFRFFLGASLLILLAVPPIAADSPAPSDATPAERLIIQAATVDAATAAVEAIGGTVNGQLAIINAVTADLDEGQREALRQHSDVKRLWRDAEVKVAGDAFDRTFYPGQIDADWLHFFGLTGYGVTVAVVDTGFWKKKGLKKNAYGQKRVLAQYDAFSDQVISQNGAGKTTDENGHGTHVTGIMVDSTLSPDWSYRGVAPGADLVSVRAFDFEGKSTYSDVIRGIDWVVSHKNDYGIRILNLSFSAPPQSFYWDDPLNLAAMRAWQAGIVVITSAGNTGPEPFTVGAPGNTPYLITVGAMTDGDAVVLFNFRGDRAVEISQAYEDPAFAHF
ncbi:MAG: S8 family serine peptidase, partial [Acidobacteriota bacterium]